MPEISLIKDNREAVNRKDDEDVPMELSILIVIKIDNGGLPTSYKFIGDGIIYDKV